MTTLPAGVIAAIRIATEAGLQLVEVDPASDVLRGLAVHRTMKMDEERGLVEHPDGSWTITHIATGLAAIRGLCTESDARTALHQLAEAFDWTESEPHKSPTAASIRADALERFDTVMLRDRRMDVAKELGLEAAKGRVPEKVAALQRAEVHVLHALLRLRNTSADVAEYMPEDIKLRFGTRMQREALRILQSLEKRGFVEKTDNRPILWRIKAK